MQLAVATAGDERLSALASVYAAQLRYLTDSSHLNDAVTTLAADAEKLAALGDEAGVAKACHVQAGALAQLGQVGATEAALDRALAAARSAGDTRRVSAVLAGAPLAALWGPSAVVRASGRCLDVVRILRMTPGNRHLEAGALSCQAVLEAMRGRADAARSMLDGSRATFEELGLGLELLENEVHAGIVELLDGDAAAAEPRLRAAYEGFAALGAGAGTERASALLARALLDQDRDDEADELTRISEERGGEDLKATIAWCGARAEVLARRGDHAAAVELARRGTTMAARTDALTDHADAQMALAAVSRAVGDEEAAASAAQRALELYEEKDNQSGVRRASAFTGEEAAVPAVDAEPAATPAAPLAGPPVEAAAGETANVRFAQQYMEAFNARDWRAAEAHLTDDFVAIDHRALAPAGRERDRATYNSQTRALSDEASDVLSEFEVVADLDDVAVGRASWRGHLNDGGGSFEMPVVIVSRRRGRQFERFEIFDPDDDPGWCARLGELLGERGRAFRAVGAQGLTQLRTHDWDGLSASFAADAQQIDRRPVGGGVVRGGDEIVAFYRGLIELAPDAQPHLVSVLDCAPDVFLVRLDVRGQAATGGEFEVPYLLLQEVRDGVRGNLELFDVDDEDAARRRFAALTRPATPPTLRAVMDRYVAACNAQDWEALGDIFAPDLRFLDRRLIGWGEGHGREEYVEVMRGRAALTDELRVRNELLAVGRAASVMRVLTSGRLIDGGGDFEIETVVLTIFSDGRATDFEIFEATDASAALERFEEIGAQSEPERLAARTCRLLTARDWDALAAIYSDDFVMTDRRVLAWEPVRGGEAAVTLFSTWVELVPDVAVTIEVIAGDEQWLVYRFTGRGHAADGGGQMEYGVILVSLTRDGQLAGSEVFDLEDQVAALARYEEVRHDRPASARELIGRYVAGMNERDLEALESLFTADLRIVDHRLVGWGELEGRDALTDVGNGMWAVAEDLRVSGELLVGGTAAHVGRFTFRGRMVDGGGDFEIATVTLNVRAGGDRVGYLEIFEATDATAALRRFEEIGAQTVPEREVVHACRLINARDWGARGVLYHDEFTVTDHRKLGWEPVEGPDAMMTIWRSWVDLVPDVEMTFELIAGDERRIMYFFTGRGHAADGGGEMEYGVILVSLYRDGRLVSSDTFDAEDHAGARACYQQLGGGAAADPARGHRPLCRRQQCAGLGRSARHLRAGPAVRRSPPGRMGRAERPRGLHRDRARDECAHTWRHRDRRDPRDRAGGVADALRVPRSHGRRRR